MVESLVFHPYFLGEERGISKKAILLILEKVAKSYVGRNLEIEIIFDYLGETVEKLNKEYKNKDKETDILSFELEESFGQIFISIHFLEIEKRGIDRLEELVKHGVLHILGYLHRTDEQFREMEEAEINLFVE